MKPAALLALLLLSACQKAEIRDMEISEARRAVTVYYDPATGCEYVARSNGEGGITPRVSEDQKSQRGCKTPLLEK